MQSRENSFTIQDTPNNKVYISWKIVNDYIKQIHKFLLSSNFQPDCIVTLHKGGIIPSAILSYHMKVNDIYDFKIIDNTVVYSKDVMNVARKNVLIVDNIIEKGEKLALLLSFLQNLNIQTVVVVSLIQKESENPQVIAAYAPKIMKKHEWAVFPWEELNY